MHFSTLFYLTLSIFTSTAFCSLNDEPQTFQYEFNVKKTISMDLEELSSLNLAFKILYDNPHCQATLPSFTAKDKVPYHGLLGSSIYYRG